MHFEISNIVTRVRDPSSEERAFLRDHCSYTDRRPPQFGGQGRVVLYDETTDSFPTGFVPGLLRLLTQAKRPYTMDDWRARPCAFDVANPPSWLFDDSRYLWQVDAWERAADFTRGIFHVGTGGGKTNLAAAIIKALRCRWLFITPGGDLMLQSAKVFARVLGERIGLVGDGRWELERVTCASAKTVGDRLKRDDKDTVALVEGTQGIFVDECHTTATASISRILDSAPNAFFRYGLSATPFDRSDQRNVVTMGGLGPVIYRRLPSELVQDGVISRPTIRMLPFVHRSPRGKKWQTCYQSEVVDSFLRNSLLVEIAKRAAKPAFLFVVATEHGETLQRKLTQAGIRSRFVWGKVKVKERDQLLAALANGTFEVLICSVIFQQGIDLPCLRSVIVGAAMKSTIAVIQRMGRGTRVTDDKTTFEVWDIDDKGCGCKSKRVIDEFGRSTEIGKHKPCGWLERHSRARKTAYESCGFEVEEADQLEISLPSPLSSRRT